MNVNAKGDVVNSGNKVTSTRSSQVNKSYRKQFGNVPKDLPVAASKEDLVEKIEGLDTEPVPASEPVEAPKPKARKKKTVKAEEKATGLAGAIAKAQDKE